MTYKTKNFLGIATVAIATALFLTVLVVGGMWAGRAQKAEAASSIYSSCDNASGRPNAASTTIKSNALYLAGNTGQSATSTLGPCYVERAASFGFNIYEQSTTTSVLATLLWVYQYSYDGIVWYNDDTSSQSGSTVTHNATTTHAFAMTGATSTLSQQVTSINAKYVRVLYSSAVATSSPFLQLTPKNTLLLN